MMIGQFLQIFKMTAAAKLHLIIPDFLVSAHLLITCHVMNFPQNLTLFGLLVQMSGIVAPMKNAIPLA